MTQLVKNQPAMWETWVQSLGWEDPLEKGTATDKIANKDVVYSKGNLLSVIWQPGGRGVWGRVDTCTCMAESLPLR